MVRFRTFPCQRTVYVKPVGRKLLHRLHCFLIFFFFGLTAAAQTTGPGNGYFLVHDFRDDWNVYDEDLKSYIPYIRELHQDYRSYSLLLDVEKNRHYYLLYKSDQENFLFINGALQKKLPANEWVVMRFDSLFKAYHQHRVLLTLYGNQPGIEKKNLYIGHKVATGQKPIVVSESFLQARPREDSPFDDFYALGALLLLAMYVFLYQAFNKGFARYFSIRDLLTIPTREGVGALTRSPFELSNLSFILLLSFLLSYLYQLVRYRGVDLFGTQGFFQEEESLGMLFLSFFIVAVVFLAGFILKYVILNTLGQIYRFDRLVNIHYFKAIQASALFYTVLGLVMIMMMTTFPVATFRWDAILFIPVTLFYLARLLLLYFSINKLSDAKNLYLFSYLCIVELVPFIIGVKFAL